MAVEDLQESLAKVEQQANSFAELLKGFVASNQEELDNALAALRGNKTGTDGAVSAALTEAGQAIEQAKSAMESAAQAARDYANNI